MQKKLIPSPILFRKNLLAWYSETGRHELPWRKNWSAYSILVSELMLQQTTVSTVIPYYKRFLKRFPTLKTLSEASLENVLELWSGLGYYSRARNLHTTAKKIIGDFKGKIPDERDKVTSLPGVGRYTAGAILSFAYDKPEALVDGNVIRVLSRIFGIQKNVKDPKVIESIWGIAWKLIPPQGARKFNSALMDLGATVCRPSSPECLICPFYKDCWARKNGQENKLPIISKDKPRRVVHSCIGLIHHKNQWAMVKRPEKGLYAGLWEFPEETILKRTWTEEDTKACFERRFGWELQVEKKLPTVKHILSHREIYLYSWICAFKKGQKLFERGNWATREQIEKMAVSSLTRRLLSQIPLKKRLLIK